MSRVFILEPTNLDLSPAEKWGKVRYIFADDRVSIWDDRFTAAMLGELRVAGFDPTADYLAIVGHMVPLAMAIAAMVAEYGKIKLLLFSSSERNYIEREVGGGSKSTKPVR